MSFTKAAIDQLVHLTEGERSRLAYLALTGKLENAVRDHLAFKIQSSHKDYYVGRDKTLAGIAQAANGSRFDLVVFDQNGNLKEATEAKQFYTFDYRERGPAKVVPEIFAQVESDAARLLELANGAQEKVKVKVNLLILVCHVQVKDGKKVAEHFAKVSKYDLHRPRMHATEDHTPDIFEGFETAFQGWQFDQPNRIDLGEWFGLSVSLTPIIASLQQPA